MLNNCNFRIVFMGTPEFAVESLKELHDHFNIVSVVTSPDKPSGRGLKIKQSAVKNFAEKCKLPVLQPQNLKDPAFINQLTSLNPDLFIVVAFRMLPEVVWKIPPKGTINLHASLLPQYRGAAPINHALINGEEKTGVTTFFINEQIDTGKIIYQESIEILPDENAVQLHDKMMFAGAKLLTKTVNDIFNNKVSPVAQDEYASINPQILKSAPKIHKEFCYINWNSPSVSIYNFIRGLSPYPAAITELVSPDKKSSFIKVYKAKIVDDNSGNEPGTIITDGRTHLSIATADGLILIEELQLSGKVRMHISEFLRGFSINNHWKAKVF